MAAPDTQRGSSIFEEESTLLETATSQRDDDSAISDLLDSALKNTLITVGTIWFVATLVAIGAFALELQLLTTIAAFVVATMMCAWLAGLSFMVVNWATRRFPIIGAWPRWKPKSGKPG